MGRKKKNVYLEMVQWLETHDGIKPRFQIARDGKRLKTKDMTLEEKSERSLASRWYYSQEYKAFKACKGILLEDLPIEYEQYREQIATLRGYEQKKVTVYGEMIQWLETHDGQYPSSAIFKGGKYLLAEEMTVEERKGKSLCSRWYCSQEYKAFKACEGIPLEKLPAEYEQYKEQIATLRRYEQIKKEKAVEKRMRKSVAKQVQNNASTRSELLEGVRQIEESISELSEVVKQIKESIQEEK